ncbi:MAG: hypothetical protein GY757_37985 [bacterium]|nr:hypothetical protein [bacterium]
MYKIRNNYIRALNQKARTGKKTLAPMLKSRLIKAEGPLVPEYEDSLLEIVRLAYQKAEVLVKPVYEEVFSDYLMEFQDKLFNKKKPQINKKQVEIISHALTFFDAFEPTEKWIRFRIKSFLGSVIDADMEDRFREVVSDPEAGKAGDLYNHIARLHIKYARDGKNHKQVLKQMWADSINTGSQCFQRNAVILKAIAEASPYMIKIRDLFLFFNQTEGLEKNKRTAVMHNTFLWVGSFLETEEHMKRLFFQIKALLDDFLYSPGVLEKDEVEKTERFLIVMGFILGYDKKRYNSLKNKFELDLDTAKQFRKEKETLARAEKSDAVKELSEMISEDNILNLPIALPEGREAG